MNVIPTEFQHHGFVFRQIYRQGNVAVFEQAKNGKVHAWEVVRIRVSPACTILGKDYPKRELYPKSEHWGENAYTCLSRERAIARATRMAKSGTPCSNRATISDKSTPDSGLDVRQLPTDEVACDEITWSRP
jgi:hypothetical protein